MAHYGLLRDYRFDDEGTADDIRGAKIYGRDDEKLGKIDDVIFDHSTGGIRYVVVDTGGWLSSKKFLVSPERIRASQKHKDDFEISATKEQIERFPAYNESDLKSDENWKNYEKRYEAAWHDGPVQHRKGSDRDITPTPDEMPEQSGSIGSRLSREQAAEVGSRIVPAGADEVTIQSSAMGIGSRWSTFEQRLRQRRRDITQGCRTCTVGPASDRGSESVADERKAV
ncbi:MAG TPA: PRC-barrel domain-containing protein [Terriglobales bacterium]|jgi:sporulation protein YlmC with PRC-barrel domain|nr:PRC-barrel domain-containing protein [Terriglobales bacterium]